MVCPCPRGPPLGCAAGEGPVLPMQGLPSTVGDLGWMGRQQVSVTRPFHCGPGTLQGDGYNFQVILQKLYFLLTECISSQLRMVRGGPPPSSGHSGPRPELGSQQLCGGRTSDLVLPC